jgi:hypothetical protein
MNGVHLRESGDCTIPVTDKTADSPHMDATVASAIARRAHLAQTDRLGGRVIDHVARVASTVPPDARSVAWLHDVLECTNVGIHALRSDGLTPLEEAALDLLTRRGGETYETYALRVAFASGDEGRLARTVKHADLDDRIASAPPALDTPPYAWARQHIANAQWRNNEPVARLVTSRPNGDALPVASGA